MKGHMIERRGRWFSAMQRDGDVVISDGNAVSEFELLFQSEDAFEPLRAFFWIAHRQTEMADCSNLKWHLHAQFIQVALASCQ